MVEGIKISFHPDFFIDLDKHIPVDEQQKFIDDIIAGIHKDLESANQNQYKITNSEILIRHITSAEDDEDEIDIDDEDVASYYSAIDKKKLH